MKVSKYQGFVNMRNDLKYARTKPKQGAVDNYYIMLLT